jgi:hypothetical protein
MSGYALTLLHLCSSSISGDTLTKAASNLASTQGSKVSSAYPALTFLKAQAPSSNGKGKVVMYGMLCMYLLKPDKKWLN